MSETDGSGIKHQDLTANGSTSNVRGQVVDVSVSGTFDATWTIERMIGKNGNWGAVASYTGSEERVLENASPCAVRVTVSNYVSGTVSVSLAADR